MSSYRPAFAPTSFDDKSEARRQDSLSSDASVKDKDPSPSASSSWFNRSRTGSEGASKPSPRNVNLYTHCGRHTNQYLFGGHSLSDSIKDLLRKRD
ncbi:hypothetical protein F4802DRAFT_367325 [Xylaria palmicola]|nr:hypothetical protein F4802DRAFT_367325 [Xylaria palmicola]